MAVQSNGSFKLEKTNKPYEQLNYKRKNYLLFFSKIYYNGKVGNRKQVATVQLMERHLSPILPEELKII
jgi:hypothetical protein